MLGMLIYHHLACYVSKPELRCGWSKLYLKKTQKCWSLPATARRKLAISDQIGCEPWRAAGLLAHKMWGWVHNGLHGMWRLNRWTFQHRFSSFHLGLEMDAIYIYDMINQLCESSHPHWWENLLWSTSLEGLISEWWMISADVQTITNIYKLNCFVVSQCFTHDTHAFSKSSDPLIIHDFHGFFQQAVTPRTLISCRLNLSFDGWASFQFSNIERTAMQHYALQCKNLICLSYTSYTLVLPWSWLYNVFSWDVYCLYFILSFYISYVHDDESLDKGSCHQVTQTALVPCGRPPKAGRLREGWPLWSYGGLCGVEHVEHLMFWWCLGWLDWDVLNVRCFRSHLMGEVGVTFSAWGT